MQRMTSARTQWTSNKFAKARSQLALLFAALCFSTAAMAVPTGSIAQPRANITYNSNIMLFFTVTDTQNINSAGLIYQNTATGNAQVETFCSNNCNTRFRGFRTGINPINLGLSPGTNRIQLWANSPDNVLDTVQFTWQPREISGIQFQRGQGEINLSWSALSGIRRYNLYVASTPGVTPQNVQTLENGQALYALQNTTQTLTGITDDISYYVRITGVDGSGESATSAEINIPALENTLPVATDDNFSIAEDSRLQANVLNNDFDPDNQDGNTTPQTLTASLVEPPRNGTINIESNGDITYTPQANFFGSDSFSYRITDDFQGIDEANVNIQVTAVNDLPQAVNDSFTLNEDNTLTTAAGALLANDVEFDNDPLSVSTTPVQAPQFGTLSLSSDGSFSYTPFAHFSGNDSFIYSLLDGVSTNQPSATVNLTVNAVNDLPVAQNDAYTLLEDAPLQANVLDNDSDADHPNDEKYQALNTQVVIPPSSGSLTLNANGAFIYTPNAEFSGVDGFTYRLTDTENITDEANVQLTVTQVNDAPTANADAYSLDEDSVLTVNAANGFLSNDFDADLNDTIRLTGIVRFPENGELEADSTGAFIYTPNAHFFGEDHFTYAIEDSSGQVGEARVTLVINNIPDAPTANADAYSLQEDSVLTVNAESGFLSNDFDVDQNDTLRFTRIVSLPEHGKLEADSTGAFSYTPNAHFFGEDHFTYAIEDSSGQVSEARVTLVISSIPDAPTASADAYSLDEDSVLTVNAANGFLSNDFDADVNDTIRFTGIVRFPENGELEADSTGAFSYTPNAHFFGEDHFTYAIEDSSGQVSEARVTLVISNIPDAPHITNDSFLVTIDEATVLDVLANDNNLDGENTLLNITQASAQFGSVSIEQGRTLLYTSAQNFEGVDTLTYQVNATGNNSDSALVSTGTATVEVVPPNDPPTAVDDTVSMDEDTTGVFNVTANDTDPENDNLTLLSVSFFDDVGQTGTLQRKRTQPHSSSRRLIIEDNEEENPGTVSIANNQVVYVPSANFFGDVTLVYVIEDIRAQQSQGRINVTVVPVNDAPQTEPDTASTLEDTPVTIDVLSNDTDVENDALRIINVDSGSGTGTISGSTITFTPTTHFNGVASLTYNIADTSNDSASGTVTIEVTPVDDPPFANDDSAFASAGQTITINPLINDGDPDGDVLTISGASASYGSASVNGLTQVSYTPPEEFSGTDTITYQISDGTGLSAQAEISVLIGDQPPTANNDSYLVDGNGNTAVIDANVGVLANDTDLEGVTLSASILGSPSYASSFTLNTDGSFHYVHDGSDNFTDSFTYTASDGSNVDSATVSLTIFKKNLAPSVCNIPHTQAVVGQNYHYTIEVQNLDEDLLTYDVTNLPGWLSFDAMNNDISGTPMSSDSSANNISIKVTDTQGAFDEYVYSVNLMSEFGTSGEASVDFGAGDDKVAGILRDKLGRIIVAGTSNNNFAFARFLANGTLDSSFGTSGIVTVDFGSTEKLYDIALTLNNQVVAIGQTFDSVNGDAETGVVKLTEDGSLDTQFNSTGTLTLDFGSNSPDYPKSIIAHENGDLTLIGYYNNGTDTDVYAMQVNSQGSLNSAFGTSGKLSLSSANDQSVSDAVLDSENNIYIAGTHTGLSDTDFMLVHIDLDSDNNGIQDGVINTGVGASGLVTYDQGIADEGLTIAVGSEGNLLLGGANLSQFWLASFSPSLTLNAGFGTSGIVTADYFSSAAVDKVTDIVQDGFGNIFMVGVADSKIGVVKLNATGTLDTTYGTSGANTFTINGDSTKRAVGALDALGQILLSGTDTSLNNIRLIQDNAVANSSLWGCDISLASANSTPSIDTLVTVDEGQASQFYAVGYGKANATAVNDLLVLSVGDNNQSAQFGQNGYVRLSQGNDFTVQSARATTSGDLLIVGFYNASHVRVLKLNIEGELDNNFASAGVQDFGNAQTSQAFDSALDSSGNLYIGITVADSTPITRIIKLDSTGALDATFGSSGIANYVGFDGFKLARGADGSINVIGQEFNSGEASLLRFTASGVLDTNFNSGFITLGVGSAIDVAVLSDGGLVALLNDSGLSLKKYTSSGVPDTNFGTSGALSLPNYVPGPYSSLTASSTPYFFVQTDTASSDVALLKLDNNGKFDASFLNAGQATLPGIINAADIKGVALESTGEMVLYGVVFDDFFLNHLSANGTLITREFEFLFDFGFGEVGKGIAIDKQGRILVAGATHDETNFNDDVVMARFAPGGMVDTSFATSGIFTTIEAGEESFNDIHINALSKATVQGVNDDNPFAGVLVANGSSVSGNFNSATYATNVSSDTETTGKHYRDDEGVTWIAGSKAEKAHITKVLRLGGVDTSFTTSALNTTLASMTNAPDHSQLNAVARTADGGLITVGQITLGASQNGLLAKFDSQGNVDTNFGASGIVQIGAVDSNNYQLYDVLIDAQGNIMTVGSKDNDLFIAAYSNTGTQLYSKVVTQSGLLVGKALALDTFGAIWVAGHSEGGFELYRFKSDLTQLHQYPSRAIGEAAEAQDIVIDSLGNVFLTGSAQIDQEWDIFVIRYPNAVGSF